MNNSQIREFFELYDVVFEQDHKTVKLCGRNNCIKLISKCDEIAPIKIPQSELPQKPENPDRDELIKWRNAINCISYYGNLETGFMNVDRIYSLYKTLTEA